MIFSRIFWLTVADGSGTGIFKPWGYKVTRVESEGGGNVLLWMPNVLATIKTHECTFGESIDRRRPGGSSAPPRRYRPFECFVVCFGKPRRCVVVISRFNCKKKDRKAISRKRPTKRGRSLGYCRERGLCPDISYQLYAYAEIPPPQNETIQYY